MFSIENPLQIRSVRRTVARLAFTKESCNNCNLPKDGRKEI
jgi:ribosomal protein L29